MAVWQTPGIETWSENWQRQNFIRLAYEWPV